MRRFPDGIPEIFQRVSLSSVHIIFQKNAIGSRGNEIQRGPRTYEHRARRKSNSSVPGAFACVATKHARTWGMKHVNTRGEIPQKNGATACATENPPGSRFFSGPAEGPFLSSSFFPTHPAPALPGRPFRPQIESMPSRELREAATEDNWILIRFLPPLFYRCCVVCFLPVTFLFSSSNYSAFPIIRDEHTDSSRVAILPTTSSFWRQDWITSPPRKGRGLYYLIDRGIKTGFNYNVGRNDRFRLSICDNSGFCGKIRYHVWRQVANKANLIIWFNNISRTIIFSPQLNVTI